MPVGAKRNKNLLVKKSIRATEEDLSLHQKAAMTTAQATYDSVADFIAGMNPQRTLELRATPEMQGRLEELIEKEKTAGLTAAEKDELDHYIVLERLIRLAKARALFRLSRK
jgi:hypothetical protein